MSRSNQTSLRLAIFDFDGTLCRVNSYHVFLSWAIRRFRAKSLLVLAGVVLRKIGAITRPTLMGLVLRTLKGKTRAEVGAIGDELYRSALKQKISACGLAEINSKRNEGCTVVILSGAFDFLLSPFCVAQNIDPWRSTRLAYEADVCTGDLDGAEHLGEAKKLYVQGLFAEQAVDWEGSSVYSDELTDLPLFSLVGKRYFIVHDGRLPPELPEGMKILRW